jgi:hypothetical protein
VSCINTQVYTPMASRRATGLAVLRAYVNLKETAPGPVFAFFDATWRAGRTMDLALRMRRHGSLTYRAVEIFASLVALPPSDLNTWVLPTLQQLGIIDVGRASDGSIILIEERVGVAEGVLEQCAAIWERLAPKPSEACAISSTDHATYAPLSQSDHQAILEQEGFPAELHEQAFQRMAAVGLLRREQSSVLGETVLWAPYVWGTEAIDIAAFLKKLPANERQALAGLSRQASDHPGIPIEKLSADAALVGAARHAGLLHATRVLAGDKERGFAFPPGLEHRVGGGLTDATHERKLFVAHILNGHMYGEPWTGRIEQPIALVRALIDRGSVGPTTAARRDYGLLEAAGIVRAEEVGGGRAMLHLVKQDVAEESLELLRLVLGADTGEAAATSVDALWIPGTPIGSPERDRRMLPVPGEAESEVIHSSVMELRKEIARKLRREEP